MAEILHFLLVPDKAAGRRVRRALASRAARWGTVVGTWGELVDQVCRAYLVAPPITDWHARLDEAARKLADAFWSDSLKSDPEGTLAVLGRELRRLLGALGPGLVLQPAGKSSMSDRGKRHLADLSRLHNAMGWVLPEGLAAIRELLAADKADATRLIAVHRGDGFPKLSPWQEALLTKLASDGGAASVPELDAILADTFAATSAGKAKSALRHLQENLFGAAPSQIPLDDTVACLAVRDHLEAAEVAAGMIQKALAGDPGLDTSEIGVLMPGDDSSEDAVREVFSRAGIPVSGLEGPCRLRNLGGEAVFHFLATRRQPAPAMALSALYASPLMPWDETTGNRLAMEIMGGEYEPEPPDGLSPEGKRMMDLILGEHKSPKSLVEALKTFGSLMTDAEGVARHTDIARGALASLGEALGKIKGKEVPWEDLSALIPQAPVRAEAGRDLYREGVAIFHEDEEPWRPVRHLFILGFSEGRYPSGLERSPVFDLADMKALKDNLGYALETPEEGIARRRALFLRQLRAASDRAVFLVPLRDAMGAELAPSGTIAFMVRLFRGMQAPEELLLILERESHRSKVEGLPVASDKDPEPPAETEIRDPDLKVDLLSDGAGKPRSVSPSGLETLMVSPLAWFLEREEIVPLSWAAESLEPMTKGTLAHEVFENLFAAAGPLSTAAKIKSTVERLLNDAIVRRAPFLLGSEWYVERRNLLKDVETAALRWREFLDRCGARILGVETTLKGVFEGLPIRGRADLLLSLPSGRIFVVDYKKSSSSSRRLCMEEGYDIQTSLYRRMLESGTVVDSGKESLARLLKEGAEIGVLYYMMDDQRALTDTSGWIPRSVSGVQELGAAISVNGEALVRERIEALRAGRIPLNRADDGESFEDVGVKPYALDVSPLVTRFAHPGPDSGEAE